MSGVVKSGRSFFLALMLSAFGATGGALVATLAFPAGATAGGHPCQDQECEDDCPWWDDDCGNRSCEEGAEESGTYCDMSDPGDGDCDTKACGHT